MRLPDNNIVRVRLIALDNGLSGHDTDSSASWRWGTTGCFLYLGDYVPHCNELNILARCDVAPNNISFDRHSFFTDFTQRSEKAFKLGLPGGSVIGVTLKINRAVV